MLQHDKDDEALQKYKAALLGDSVAGSGAVVVDPDDPRKVILKKLALVIEGRDDETIDLTDDLANIKKKTFVLKEGVKFRIKIDNKKYAACKKKHNIPLHCKKLMNNSLFFE